MFYFHFFLLNKRKEILRPTIKKSYEKLDKKVRKLYEMYRPTDLVEKMVFYFPLF